MERDIGFGEFCAFCQQRLASEFGESVREAIAKVKPGGMPAFSILAPAGTSDVGLFGIEGHHLQIRANREEIEFAAGTFSLTTFQNDSGFENRCSGNKATSVRGNRFQKCLSFRFNKKNGGNCRSVDYHTCRTSAGKPVLVVAHDFIGAPRIENRQRINASKYFPQLAQKEIAISLPFQPFEALLKSSFNRPCHRFPGLGGNLSRQAFHLHALDAHSHM
jgi:hypothetical protein